MCSVVSCGNEMGPLLPSDMKYIVYGSKNRTDSKLYTHVWSKFLRASITHNQWVIKALIIGSKRRSFVLANSLQDKFTVNRKLLAFKSLFLLVNGSFRRRHVSFVRLLLATGPIV